MKLQNQCRGRRHDDDHDRVGYHDDDEDDDLHDENGDVDDHVHGHFEVEFHHRHRWIQRIQEEEESMTQLILGMEEKLRK